MAEHTPEIIERVGNAIDDVPSSLNIAEQRHNEAVAALDVSAHHELLAACVEFCRKVDDGEAWSVGSYVQMMLAIKKAQGQS